MNSNYNDSVIMHTFTKKLLSKKKTMSFTVQCLSLLTKSYYNPEQQVIPATDLLTDLKKMKRKAHCLHILFWCDLH